MGPNRQPQWVNILNIIKIISALFQGRIDITKKNV